MSAKRPTIDEIIEMLDLAPLVPEGGYWGRAYVSPEIIAAHALPARYQVPRHLGSAIYYLITPESFSAIHRLTTDELWHFYLGDPIEQLRLHADGTGEVIEIGTDLASGQRPIAVVPHGTWESSRLLPGGAFALVGNSLAPGFEDSDYEGGDPEALAQQYPSLAEEIRRFATAGD